MPFDLLEIARSVRDSDGLIRGDIEAALADKKAEIIGVDEVGRGCLAGAVFAAAVILDYKKLNALDDRDKKLIRDSKTLSAAQRMKIIPIIDTIAKASAVAEASVEEIDRLGIVGATFLAMRRDIDALKSPSAFLLIDGNMPLPDSPIPQLTVIKGDGLCFAIAAASILAKEARDAYMQNSETSYPGYSFGDNVGYGTKKHIDAIYKIGPCALHRRSFAPVRDLVAGR